MRGAWQGDDVGGGFAAVAEQALGVPVALASYGPRTADKCVLSGSGIHSGADGILQAECARD